MAKKFKKSKFEIVLQFVKGLARKMPCINETENEILSEEFSEADMANGVLDEFYRFTK